MSEIKQINVPNVVIPKFGTNEVWLNGVPFVPSNHPSVTTQIGFPIVEIPGCVKMHKDNQDKVTRLPFDKDLVNQDEDGVTIADPYRFKSVINDVARADKYIDSKQGLLYEHNCIVDCFPKDGDPPFTVWDKPEEISPWLIDPYDKPINPNFPIYDMEGAVRY